MATLKLVFGLAVFALVILVGIKVIPPYFSNYEFQDAIKAEALQSTYTPRSEEDIRTAVIKQAHSYDIELTDKQVHVSRSGSGIGTGTIAIDCDYSVPLELPGYSTNLEFHVSTKNRGIY
jgi:transglutaminase/protease-like cytokinesis protein 3